jgi:hypothetical protein
MIKTLDKTKKILLASGSGLVLLLGFLALKAKASQISTPEQQQELLTLSDTLKENGSDLGQLAQQLDGAEKVQVEAIRQYIDDLSQKLADGSFPSAEEVKQINEKLGGLTKQLENRQIDTPENGSKIISEDKPNDISSYSESPKSISETEAIPSESRSNISKDNFSSGELPFHQTKGASSSDKSGNLQSSGIKSQGKEAQKDNDKKQETSQQNLGSAATIGGQAITQMNADVNEVEAALEQFPDVVDEISNSFSKFKENITSQSDVLNDNQIELVSALDNTQESYQNHQTQIGEQQNNITTQFQSFLEQFESLFTHAKESFDSASETEQVLKQQLEDQQQNNQQIIENYILYTQNFIEEINNQERFLIQEEAELDEHLIDFREIIDNLYQNLEEQLNNSENDSINLIESINQHQTELSSYLLDFSKNLTDEENLTLSSAFSKVSNRLQEDTKGLEKNLEDSIDTTKEKIKDLLSDLNEYFQQHIYLNLETNYELAGRSITEVIELLNAKSNIIKNYQENDTSLINFTEKIKESSDIMNDIKEQLSSYSL